MEANLAAKRLVRSSPTRLLSLAALASAVLLAGCGGGSAGPNVASVTATTSTTSSAAGASHSGAQSSSHSSASSASGTPSRATLGADELAFSKCMRANGVPTYPDPRAGGGAVFQKGDGIDPFSPTFKAAHAKCQKLVPNIGGGPGSGPPPSAQAMSAMLKVAACMRAHGVPDFPEPRTTVPADPLGALGGNGVISDIDGVILLFPSTIDERSPLFTRAAARCKFPLHNH